MKLVFTECPSKSRLKITKEKQASRKEMHQNENIKSVYLQEANEIMNEFLTKQENESAQC